MKIKHLFIQIVALLFALPLLGTAAQAASITIDVLQTFDYPGAGNLTRPQKINDANEMIGEYVDASLVTRGFFRAANGLLSPPLVEPNDTGNFTEGRGINNNRMMCGDYIGSDGTFHGFFLTGNSYSEYDVPNSTSTNVLGINNAGDFVGNFVPVSTGIPQPFVNIGGTVTAIDIAGATFGAAYQLNASNQYVGYYSDSAGVTHGFYLDRNGTLIYPVDPSGSTGTILFGLNDHRWMVGRYSDSAGVTHGLLFIAPNKFTTFDYPGSTFTSLNGINRQGYICGRYIDNAAIEHGFLARAHRTPGNAPVVKTSGGKVSAPARVVNPSAPASKAPAS